MLPDGTIFSVSPCNDAAVCNFASPDGATTYSQKQYIASNNNAVFVPASSTGTETLTITFTCPADTGYSYFLDEAIFNRIGSGSQQR